MKCAECNHQNREGRRFCAKCGAALSVTCPACGFANEAEDAFCGGCGARLDEPRAAADGAAPGAPPAEAERRQVTIVFADLSGFTTLSSTHDPEETHDVLSRFFAAVDGVVESYGGTVDKHIGDAVMALFGAPIAHTDDAERACRAALDIHATMRALSRDTGLALTVHAGIASGPVVASGIGSEAHHEYTVLGDSVNLAARLVEMATAGETLISDAVRRTLSHLVEAVEVGDVDIKGLSKPVKVWRMTALGGDGAVTRFVGRRAETRQFAGVLETTRESGNGQAILVRGEAGIGKSRLVEEFATLSAEDGFVRHTGWALDFGVGRRRDAIRGIARSLLGIPQGTGKATRAEAAARALSAGLVAEEQAVFLYDLLDIPQDPAARAMYDAMDNDRRNLGKGECMATLVKRLSARQPLLLIVEDLHWAAPLTVDHLTLMAAATAEGPALLVMTSRIEGDPLDGAWRQAARAALMTVDLAPLREDEALSLAGEFVDSANEFALNCIARAEGNPLFLEQLLRSAEGAEGEDIPGSVQSIVLARVDRLSEGDRRALHAAAILGQRFALETLHHLIEEPAYRCDALVRHHVIRPAGAEYMFAHALIWESVYASVLKSRRRELHRRAADWFADRDPGVCAEHLDRANDPRAPVAYLRAARHQTEVFHFEQAMAFIERGLALADDPAHRYGLLMLQGECLREIGRSADSIAVYREALQVATAAGMRVTDDYDEAFGALDEAEAVAHKQGLDTELSQIHYYRGSLHFPLGNIEGCLEEHERALASAERAGSAECQARALSGLGDAYYSRGRTMTALEYFRRCIALCRAHNLTRIEVGNHYMVAWNRLYMNEIEGALEDALVPVDAAVRVGHRRAEIVARLTAGGVLTEKGDLDAAATHCERGLEIADAIGAERFKPFMSIFIGRIYLARSGYRPQNGSDDEGRGRNRAPDRYPVPRTLGAGNARAGDRRLAGGAKVARRGREDSRTGLRRPQLLRLLPRRDRGRTARRAMGRGATLRGRPDRVVGQRTAALGRVLCRARPRLGGPRPRRPRSQDNGRARPPQDRGRARRTAGRRSGDRPGAGRLSPRPSPPRRRAT